jgi:hypothetical protein
VIKAVVLIILCFFSVRLFYLHLQDGIVLSVAVHFIPDRSAAKSAAVLVFIPFWQHEKEEFIDRYRLAAFWAVELYGLEFIIAWLVLSFALLRGISGWSLHSHIQFPFPSNYDNDFCILQKDKKNASG